MCDEDFDYGDPGSMFDYDGDGELDHAERALYYDYLDRSSRDDWDDDDEDDDEDDWDSGDDFSKSYSGLIDDDLAEELKDEGIDPVEFELMSDYEKYKALDAALLDEDDYEEYFDNYEFFDDNWCDIEDLQGYGIDIERFLKLDDEDKYDLLMSYDLDPDDYCDLFEDDDYPWDRKEVEEEDDDDDEDEDRVELDVTKIVKKDNRKVDLTGLIGNIYSKCDVLESMKGWKKSGKVSLRDQFRIDLMKLCMFLSVSDGNVDDAEVRFFSSQIGAALSADDIRKFIKSQKIDSEEFAKKPPLTVVELVNNKELLDFIGAKIKYVVQDFVHVFETVGNEIILCDGSIDEKEKEDLKRYIDMIYKYSGIGKFTEKTQIDETELGDNVYGEAVYKCDEDIPAGMYKLFVSKDRGFFSICMDANHKEIVINQPFENQAYVYINESHYLELRGCFAVPIEDAVMFDGGECPPGEYYVGRELSPGEYKISVEQGRDDGYVAVLKLMADGNRQIITNNFIRNSAYVEVEEGQILELRHCTLKR